MYEINERDCMIIARDAEHNLLREAAHQAITSYQVDGYIPPELQDALLLEKDDG